MKTVKRTAKTAKKNVGTSEAKKEALAKIIMRCELCGKKYEEKTVFDVVSLVDAMAIVGAIERPVLKQFHNCAKNTAGLATAIGYRILSKQK